MNLLVLAVAVLIPMRDGVHLNATVYKPGAPAPCIVALTPYTADYHRDRGMYFASHGWPFAAVDVRGRGQSEGVFRPNIQEAQDGYDVVEWFARQPYCDGKVGMWGGSYLGYSQWAAAKEFPPHLATIVPTAAPYMGVDFPMRNNIFYPFAVQWLTLTTGSGLQLRMFSDDTFWSDIYREWHRSGRPFRELDAVLGVHYPVFQEWLQHPEPDAYWDAYNPTADQYARMQLPILTITGAYDDDQPGALEHYKQHMRNASPEARARHYLIVGPWDHAGTGRSHPELDIPRLHLDWYAWTLRDGAKPAFLQKRVAYYVMGADRWRYADTLEEVTAREQVLYLDFAHKADEYRYDPRDARGAEVVYHSAPFEQDTEISGFFRLSAWISIDCPDTDLYVSVYDIGRNGESTLLSTDAMRARYREGLRTPKLIRTRAPLRYDFERFTFVSRQIKRGHRLRLVVAPTGRLIDSPFTQKNYNGGGVVAHESAKDARPVTVRLHHDRSHPSALYVPIGHRSRDAARTPNPLQATRLRPPFLAR
jgi:uncharacterized protein